MNMKKSDYVRMDYAHNYNGIRTSKKGSPSWQFSLVIAIFFVLTVACVLVFPVVEKVVKGPKVGDSMMVIFGVTIRGNKFSGGESVKFTGSETFDNGSVADDANWCVTSVDESRSACMWPLNLIWEFWE